MFSTIAAAARFDLNQLLRHSPAWACGRKLRRMATATVLLIAFGLFTEAAAQVTAPTAEVNAEELAPPKPETITLEALEQLRKQIEAATEIDEDQKKKILETHQRAMEAFGRAVKLETQAPIDQASIEGLAVRARELQAELSAAPAPLLEGFTNETSLAELTAGLATRQPQLQQAKDSLAQLELEPNRRSERRTVIVGEQATLATRKAAIEAELAAPAPADESSFATAARRALNLARLREINAEGPANQAEISKYDAAKALDMPNLRIQLARKEVTRLQQEVDALNKRITLRRSKDAEYIADQLALFAKGQPTPTPYSQSITERDLFFAELTNPSDIATANETAEKARENLNLTEKISQATTDVRVASKALESLRSLKARTNEKIARVGLTGAIGLELRGQLRTLTDPQKIRQRCLDRQNEMREIEYSRLDLEDQRAPLAERLQLLAEQTERTTLNEIEMRLAFDRTVTLTTLGQNFSDYFNKLGELDATEQEHIRELDEFLSFIRENVLWIRSHRIPGMTDVAELPGTIRWFASLTNWLQVRDALLKDATQQLWLYSVITILICMLFLVQSRFLMNLASIAEVTSRSTCREFFPTARAALLTVILAMPWPALAGFVSWRLLSDASAPSFVKAVGHGLLAVTIGSWMLNLVRHLCRPNGLGLAHFEWPKHSVKMLRSRIRLLMFIVLPLLFVETTLNTHENPQGRDALERLAFILSLLIDATFLSKILSPKTGVFRDYLAAHANSWAFRFKWIVYVTAVALPITLAVLAAAGVYYTAFELNWRLHLTLWLMVTLIVLRCFLLRWFVVSHRRLRIEQARQRRQAMMEEAEASPSNVPKVTAQEAIIDLQEVSDQTQRLINSGLAFVCLLVTWFIWVEVLPALGVVGRWELWPTTVDARVEYTGEDGEKLFRTEPQIRSITVADALVSIFLVLLTITASRNIPGLLEITVLQRLPLEPASRYAFRMVARYLIFVVCIICAGAAVGIGWAQVQWLVAALSLGLGFGLQEIFANLVSGLIILFERPVRIGDVVTIGDVSGTVSRIQIRATTILDWDRKEYIVPNKEFVTGRLLNWTLSDKVNRVVISVGVAYGSDTALARSLLLQVAKNHPEVLDDPPAVATFEGFGDSTLNLVLRCFLPNLDNRLGTITELHEAVDREFKQAQLEISFPQRDLHLRTLPPEFRVYRDKAGPPMTPERETPSDLTN